MMQWLNENTIEPFWELLFPQSCIICGKKIEQFNMCVSCDSAFQTLVLSDFDVELNHTTLINKSHILDNFYALFFFHKQMKVQKLIHRIKYDGYQELGIIYGERLGQELKKKNWNVNAIVPVPMHPKKLKKRGYNQAELIALGCSNVLNLPIANNLLIKSQNTKTQTKLSGFSRVRNSKDVFETQQTQSEFNHLLLIDDVFTTGSTLVACAKKLKSIEGVSNVSASTLAMTL